MRHPFFCFYSATQWCGYRAMVGIGTIHFKDGWGGLAAVAAGLIGKQITPLNIDHKSQNSYWTESAILIRNFYHPPTHSTGISSGHQQSTHPFPSTTVRWHPWNKRPPQILLDDACFEWRWFFRQQNWRNELANRMPMFQTSSRCRWTRGEEQVGVDMLFVVLMAVGRWFCRSLRYRCAGGGNECCCCIVMASHPLLWRWWGQFQIYLFRYHRRIHSNSLQRPTDRPVDEWYDRADGDWMRWRWCIAHCTMHYLHWLIGESRDDDCAGS